MKRIKVEYVEGSDIPWGTNTTMYESAQEVRNALSRGELGGVDINGYDDESEWGFDSDSIIGVVEMWNVKKFIQVYSTTDKFEVISDDPLVGMHADYIVIDDFKKTGVSSFKEEPMLKINLRKKK